MASGRYHSDEDLSREGRHALDDSEQDLRAIAEGVASVDRGHEGATLDEAFDRLRTKYQS